MKTNSRRNGSRRKAERGAILMVVLIVMVALLGLGMTGLFLTSTSIQMNTNINLRNQALVIAEAGIERARRILNDPTYTPPVPTYLAGSNASIDEIPTSTGQCDGQMRGAILVDPFAASTPCTSTPCALNAIDYPSLDRRQNLPSAAGTVSTAKLGTYTVYVRQDLSDCRMGNFVCDISPALSTSLDGGVGGSGGSFGVTTCTPPVGAPTPNGGIVVRSEGVAMDNRTRVVLEVTMTPAQGLQKPQNTPMSALCASGANGCDENSSVQDGIVVNSTAPQSPPPSSGGVSAGGTTGSGGVSGSGGVTASGGSTTAITGTGGVVTSGGVTSSGGSGSGGKTGSGGSGGAGGSTGCVPSQCPLLATMGLYGQQTSTAFDKWLATHSSNCLARNLDTEHNVITDAMLAPYKVIIVLDVDHLPQDYVNWNINKNIDFFQAVLTFLNPTPKNRKFGLGEVQAIKRWVQGGGGLLVTQGYADGLNVITNANAIVNQFGLVYYSPDCALNPNCPQQLSWEQDVYGIYHIKSFAAHPVTVGMTDLYLSGYWPISGYPTGGGFPTSPTALPAGFQVLGTTAPCQNCKVANLTTNALVAGSVGKGRVVAYGDEWVTFDYAMADPVLGPTAKAFWNNSLKWLGQCP